MIYSWEALLTKTDITHQLTVMPIIGGIMKVALIVLGLILIILGVGAGVFTSSQSQLFGLYTTTSTPYKEFMIPLIIGGAILIIVGAVIPAKRGKD